MSYTECNPSFFLLLIGVCLLSVTDFVDNIKVTNRVVPVLLVTLINKENFVSSTGSVNN